MRVPRIAVIGLYTSNAAAVRNAFLQLSVETIITNSAEDLDEATHVVLPGVGAFGAAIGNLKNMSMLEALSRFVENGKPLMGICLGMQLLTLSSTESPDESGLGIFPSACVRMQNAPTIPHVGWNEVQVTSPHLVFDGVESPFAAFFSHSFFVPVSSPTTCATSQHGDVFSAAIAQHNVVGLQFHPEKSQGTGLKILSNFAHKALRVV